MRSRAPVFSLKNGLIVLGLGLLAIWSWMGLASCHSDRVAVNAKDPQSPQYAYRQDELALLSMLADDIQELERKKQYSTIYDDYASDDFKSSISRRRFLIITNCVETYLGGMDSDGYDPHDLGFRRETVKGASNHFLDVLNRKVHRMMGLVDEQLVFIPHDLNFKLNGLYWISKDKQFLQCVAESPLKDQESQPAATEATGEATQPASQTGATTVETGQATEATGSPAATDTETNASGTAETKSQETSTQSGATLTETSKQQAPTSSTPVNSPVQEMKPAEARKATSIHARPAGAGAVIDQRPSAPAKKKPAPAGDNDNASAQTQPPIPSNESSTGSEHRRIEAAPSTQQNSKPIPSSIPPLKPGNSANDENTSVPTPR